jgi:hypothetical protein
MYGISLPLEAENTPTITIDAITQKRRHGCGLILRQVRNGTSNDHGNKPATIAGM